ncbi:MAG: excinuclease ABC subunit C [Calditrichaeota bacterium]|nr:excinuclease ABC subunit C [Calditrichota bacterium]MCB9069532.1 excinuclease ABC subunit C [Calditrichia bacterium]
MKTNAVIEEKLANLPTLPGVYLYRNENDKILYVGKAKNLRSRVRSYFQDGANLDPRKQRMVRQIRDLDTILVDSEVEALILEANLIKEHKPRYNVTLKDDKSYPYIRITNEPFPRVFVTRRIIRDGSRYLGPYTEVRQLRYIVKSMNKIFPVRSCKFFLDDDVIAKKKVKICLDYHIKRCQGPCEGFVSSEDYTAMIRQVEQFLRGKTRDLLRELNERMQSEAEKMNFEEAARIRDQIKMIDEYHFISQKVVLRDEEDRDVIALAIDDDDGCAVVFRIRDGKVVGRQHFYLDNVAEQPTETVLTTFIQQYYLKVDQFPRQILLPESVGEEQSVIENWLSEQSGHKIELSVPQIGEKRKLISLCQKNAKFLLDELMLQKMQQKDHIPHSVQQLQKNLNMEHPPRRIDGFDISNIHGKDAVASMVCFIDGRPRKSEYRIFKIRSKDTPDDFAMMHEAVFRRYKRVLAENLDMPDLILIDGGKGQLSSAVAALKEAGVDVAKQPIIGLAKRLEEVFVPEQSDPLNIPKSSTGLKLLQQTRDEAHRFAITHFRKQHKKSQLKSPLDDVPGIGPARKNHLLKTFGSLKRLREAAPDELQKQGKLPENLARELWEFLQKSD